jgi:hypothetical protein
MNSTDFIVGDGTGVSGKNTGHNNFQKIFR